jgi:TonB family protein
MKLIQEIIEARGRRRVAVMLTYAAFATCILFCSPLPSANAVDAQSQTPALPHGSIRISCKPIAERDGMTLGHLVNRVPPIYPDEAKQARIEGTAILSATITQSGKLEHLEVISGPTVLQQATLQAVRQWQYEPYLMQGKPIAVRVEITALYSLGRSVLLPPF